MKKSRALIVSICAVLLVAACVLGTLAYLTSKDTVVDTFKDGQVADNTYVNIEPENKTVDLFIFMGQSNMAGRGISTTIHPEKAPIINPGAGYEFRAVSDPTKLYLISEPFGVYENKSGGLNDIKAKTKTSAKTGSLVTAFANSYYEQTNVPIVGVSASVGGTKISSWQPGGAYLTDAINRLNEATNFLTANGYTIRHKYMMWCQGESDAEANTLKEDYVQCFNNILTEMLNNGIEDCFMIRIGRKNLEGEYDAYDNMISWQTEIAQTTNHVVMASTLFAQMRDRGLMKDQFHYYQQAYNEVGADAGINVANYVNSIN